MNATPQPVCILHLTLKKKWFDLIASGEKIFEYREVKEYWTKRFYDRTSTIQFDEIHFRNGYKKDAPFMRVKWLGIGTSYDSPLGDNLVYAIRLGQVLEIRR